MKNRTTKKLQLVKKTITRIEQLTQVKIKGGTLPASAPVGLSAHGSQCGNQMCY
ncbi:hypothetical protein [uncultured Kordia sp.]|uniref:hypothetical protein n=1 Tax=uncultured Kordia sp. TaxID=507699 RepID=UPI00261C9772|nr:hypothetical protein [uncultured Kordia sp.]